MTTPAQKSRLANFFNSPYFPKPQNLLVSALAILIIISLLMIASASIPFAQTHNMADLRFFWLQSAYVGLGVVVGWIIYQIPLKWYFNFPLMVSAWLLIILLLILTLFSTEINGSNRWLDLGFINLQVSEFAKLLMVLIMSDYVVRRSAEVRESIWAGWRLLMWYTPVLLLLYLQPDAGSMMVIGATAFVVLFVSGSPYRHYLTLLLICLPLGGLMIWQEQYRQSRIMSFLDPFDDVRNTDFQLSRSLVAFGRGETTGVGYGDSVLKLLHLPEAHTDFVLAITGEELGFLGVACVLGLLCVVVFCVMRISLTALKRRQLRLSYMLFGFGVVIFGQIVINAGMAMGALPTKGLTLPFYSYGGSSMLMFMIMMAMVLKVANQSDEINAQNKNREY